MSKEVYITKTNCITPLGFDVQSNFKAVLEKKTGVSSTNTYAQFPEIYLAEILDAEIDKHFSKLTSEGTYTRLEKLAILALQPVLEGKQITNKSVLILSSTKGNIKLLQENTAIAEANLGKLAQKIANFFGFSTQPIVVSNACVSGVMALSVAKRMLQFSEYEEAFVVAADEVSEFVISGFNSFQALSNQLCKPYDKDRKGINLGEAVAAAHLTLKKETALVRIAGDASVNDANHISGPSRTGEGLFRSIKAALNEAEIPSEDIDFISSHGTATLYNDEMEAIAFGRSNLLDKPLFSLKANYGHTLGASGLLETVISIEALQQNTILPSLGYKEMGVSQPVTIYTLPKEVKTTYFLKTASGFGGCNTAMVFEKLMN
ncbi:3-oxoacyl-[acyl-carrier-protein] synthase-1 [Mesonia hippocampi]|uniref:3-oxoacyl-[acyl-carrier-protein] synthase-1 n=1 Tax=Mesonia hippocampi TaxID=1628250 RepID=A0A840EHT5_9FLAO|nr:beta-ketoacyl synthase N-terminal-like domain-containing protein [Mesonia hippocampi]MBB4117979.1 3-oxoacyl-[acyl-carrier-protein] synthase-1 [Mesonia hippocampi]